MTKYAEDQRKRRTKKRAEGYVLKQIWALPEAWPKIKKNIDKENAKWI